MGLLQTKFFLFLLLFAVYLKISLQIPTCSNNSFFIQYPFKLLQQGQTPHHITPYDLKCNKQGAVVLTLPLSGEFYFRNIDYFEQKIELYDLENCLPGRLKNLSLSYSPFVAVSYQNYTFFSCPRESSSSRNLTAISCLSNSTASVVAASPVSTAEEGRNVTGCRVIYSLEVPVSRAFERVYDGVGGDLQLAWNDPRAKGDRKGKPGVLTIILVCAITISTALLAALYCIRCGLGIMAVALDIEEVNTQSVWSYSSRVWKMARIKLSSPRQHAPVDEEATFTPEAVAARPQPQPSEPRVAAVAVAATLGESSPAPSTPSVAAEPLHGVFPFMPPPPPEDRRGDAASVDGLSSTPSSPSVAADRHDDDFLMYPDEGSGAYADALDDDFSFMTPLHSENDVPLIMYPLPAYDDDDFIIVTRLRARGEADDEFLFDATIPDDELPTEDVIIGGNECISGPNGDSCTICLGEYKASERLTLIRKCNHCFHAVCLELWLQRKNTCPICRTNVI